MPIFYLVWLTGSQTLPIEINSNTTLKFTLVEKEWTFIGEGRISAVCCPMLILGKAGCPWIPCEPTSVPGPRLPLPACLEYPSCAVCLITLRIQINVQVLAVFSSQKSSVHFGQSDRFGPYVLACLFILWSFHGRYLHYCQALEIPRSPGPCGTSGVTSWVCPCDLLSLGR